LGHEVDAAEDNGAGLHLGGGAGEVETVAIEIGQFLDLAVLVIVSEEGRVFAGLELLDFVEDVSQNGGHGRLLVFCVAEDEPTSSFYDSLTSYYLDSTRLAATKRGKRSHFSPTELFFHTRSKNRTQLR